VVVALLLVVILAAVLVPPAVRAHAARRDAFLGSFAPEPGEAVELPAPHVRSLPVQRRRQILGGLLIAMAGTGLAGLLPTFRVLLVVHLFLLDGFLGYVAVLARLGDRRARAARPAVAPVAHEADGIDLDLGLGAGGFGRRHVAARRPPSLHPERPSVAPAAG
jgi:hypothetical protein